MRPATGSWTRLARVQPRMILPILALVATAGMAFVWDFAGDGVSSNAQAIVKVMGIEMVYIPEGPFYVGDTDNNRPDGNQHVLCCTYIDSPDPSKTASETIISGTSVVPIMPRGVSSVTAPTVHTRLAAKSAGELPARLAGELADPAPPAWGAV